MNLKYVVLNLYHIYHILKIILHYSNIINANLVESLNVRDLIIKVIKLYCRLLKCSSLYQPNVELYTREVRCL